MGRRKPIPYSDEMGRALQAVASTPEGRVVLRHVMNLSGYHRGDVLRLDPKTFDVNVDASMYNLALRNVWQNIRQFMSWETITLVEKPEPEPLSKAKKDELLDDQEDNDA